MKKMHNAPTLPKWENFSNQEKPKLTQSKKFIDESEN